MSFNYESTVCIFQHTQMGCFCVRRLWGTAGVLHNCRPAGPSGVGIALQPIGIYRLHKTAQRASAGLRTPWPPLLSTCV